ncbi:25S rRNA (adenine645-N1)-methyltransferase [Ophidiomyces ophidiicola]|nr:25S rRNA (adenine645-N1)-methyltransferase [Ophidiomyces ophidiicola]
MFTVPGWSVSAAELKAQQQPLAVQQSAPKEDLQSSVSKSTKRKRKDGTGDKVTNSNVDEMWRKHIEGRPKRNNSKQVKKQKKKEKIQKNGTSDTGSAPNNGSEPPQKKVKTDGSLQHIKNVEAQPLGSKPARPSVPSDSHLTTLQKTMRDKLVSARFRHLNETLYTTPSTQALKLFTESPELFAEYHTGFSRQVKESWPSNPVDHYILSAKKRGAIRVQKGKKYPETPGELIPLPRRPSGLCTVADLGCGDAQFSRALSPLSKKLKLKILSYDLHEGDPLITKADISSLPLEDGTVDIAIFCLSLMGTNWVSFAEEAWRVLRGDGKGECWVSEVKSRFGKVTRKNKQSTKPAPKNKGKQKKRKGQDNEEADNTNSNDIFAEDAGSNQNSQDETDISTFVEVFRTRGFILKPQSVDKSNKMFVKMEFVKHGMPTKGKWASAGGPSKGPNKRFLEPEAGGLSPEEEAKALKPCVYKLR